MSLRFDTSGMTWAQKQAINAGEEAEEMQSENLRLRRENEQLKQELKKTKQKVKK